MARKVRIEYGGACYHVINRGNYRRNLFAETGAAEAFQACLFEAAERFGWRVHAFVIMRNHFHLALETPEPNLSEGMKWLQGTWVARFNRFHGQIGRPFQGRYKGLHVEPGHALAQVAHYIHLNPVRARMVDVSRLAEYSWSSLPWFMSRRRPPCLDPDTVLAESGRLPDTKVGWRRYLDYLGVIAEEDPRRRREKYGHFSRGWFVGSAEFKLELKKQLAAQAAGRKPALLGADRQAQREAREQLWEDGLNRAAKALGVNLAELPSRKSAPEKVVLAAIMKHATSVSNRWLAERLAMGEPASVSQFVRRFHLAGSTGAAAFKDGLSRFKT